MGYKTFMTVDYLSNLLQGCILGELDVMFPQSKHLEAPSARVKLIRNGRTPQGKYLNIPELDGALWADICAPLLSQTDKWIQVLQVQSYLETLKEQVDLDLNSRLAGSSWASLIY